MQFPGRVDPNRMQALQQIRNLKIERCIGPYECENPAIRAHAVQKSAYLKLLQQDGHVMAVSHRVSQTDGASVDFEPLGIQSATTFTGLCSIHDNAIFAPIEKTALDLEDLEHLFLLAYRSALNEFHEQIEAASRLQSAYQYRVEQGLDDPREPTKAAVTATDRIAVACETYQYKVELDAAYLARDFVALQHHVVRIAVARPTVAGSSLFSVDDVYVGNETLRLHLNVLPISAHETIAVFSYAPRFGRAARRHLRPMLRSDDRMRLHDLSRILIDGCGKLVVAPDYLDSWTTEKRNAIVQYYVHTALDGTTKYDSPHFELFIAPA